MYRPISAIRAAALACAALLSAACADRAPATFPTEVPPPAAGMAALRCTAQVGAGTLSCRPEGGAPSGVSAAIVGGQGTNVRLRSSGTSYDGSSVFRSDVTVENLTAQVLGTADGVTAAPEGVRVFFATGPTVTAGTGAVSVANADGTGVFTGGAQPYFQYAGLLLPGDTTQPKEWRFDVPSTVVTFAFTVYVSAPVAREAGWVSVTPIAPSLLVGDTMRLSAAVHAVTGSSLDAPVAWETSNPAVATVDAGGLVTAVDSGTATITAASGGRTGRVTVVVDRTRGVPRGTVVSFDIVPGTVSADGLDSARLRVVMRRYSWSDLQITLLPPGVGQFSSTCRAFGVELVSETDVAYACTVAFPEGARSGMYRVTALTAVDRTVTGAELAAAGAPTFLNVRSPNEDVTPPEINGFFLETDTVIAGSGQMVSMLIAATDAFRGLERVSALVTHPESRQRFGCAVPMSSVGGSSGGTFRCRLPLPDWVRGGAWVVESVSARDLSGNTRTLATADLRLMGWPADFTVVSENPDLVPPEILEFSFSPGTVAGNGVDSVRVTARATDDRSLVRAIAVRFTNADGVQRDCVRNASPPQASLSMDCAAAFTAADAGAWHVAYVRAIDVANNERVFRTADLQAMGYPTELVVQ